MEGNEKIPEQDFVKRELPSNQWEGLSEALSSLDVFVQIVARKMLGDSTYHQEVLGLTKSEDPAMQLQALLTLLKT